MHDARTPSSVDTAQNNALAFDAAIWQGIVQSIEQRADRLLQFRNRLHAMPEASGEEVATTALIADTLREAGYEPRIMRGGTGIVADLDLGAKESFIAMRSELDCVRVNDDKQEPYASSRPGLCHACGHDAHSTIVLASALVLKEMQEQLRAQQPRHNVRFVFQPAEETATGARSMIEQGAIDGVEAMIALHVDPSLPVGTVGLRKGPLTAACRSFHIAITGQSGHSARPHEAIDPIPAAINIVSMFYQLGPRSIDSRHPLALTVASINAGSSFNAIPDEARLDGTLRASRAEDMQAVQQRMEQIIRGVCDLTGCRASMTFDFDAPATNNHPIVTDFLAESAHAITEPGQVTWVDVPSMGGEDFAFYQELIPGSMARVGIAGEERGCRPLHSSMFDIDERVLPLGVKLMTRSVLQLAMNFAPQRA
jgi:amidohydrolase